VDVTGGPTPLQLLLDLPWFRHATVKHMVFERLWKELKEQQKDAALGPSNSLESTDLNAVDASSRSLDHIVLLADRITANQDIFGRFWKGAAAPTAIGEATRKILDVWAKKLSQQDIEAAVSRTQLEIPQRIESDLKSCRDSFNETRASVEVLIAADWLQGIRSMNGNLLRQLFEHLPLTADNVKLFRRISSLMQPADVETCLANAMPCFNSLIQHGGVFPYLDWLKSTVTIESQKQLLSRIVFSLLRTKSDNSNFVACHGRESVEAVEALLTAYPELARSKDGNKDKLLPLQVLCLEAEIVNSHTVKIAKALRRRAPEVQQLPLPKTRRHNSVGNFFVTTAEAEVRHRRLVETEAKQSAALEELQEALAMSLESLLPKKMSVDVASHSSPSHRCIDFASLAPTVRASTPAAKSSLPPLEYVALSRPLQSPLLPPLEPTGRSKRSSSFGHIRPRSSGMPGSQLPAKSRKVPVLPLQVLDVKAGIKDRASVVPAWKAGDLGILDAETHKKLAIRGSSLGRYW